MAMMTMMDMAMPMAMLIIMVTAVMKVVEVVEVVERAEVVEVVVVVMMVVLVAVVVVVARNSAHTDTTHNAASCLGYSYTSLLGCPCAVLQSLRLKWTLTGVHRHISRHCLGLQQGPQSDPL